MGLFGKTGAKENLQVVTKICEDIRLKNRDVFSRQSQHYFGRKWVEFKLLYRLQEFDALIKTFPEKIRSSRDTNSLLDFPVTNLEYFFRVLSFQHELQIPKARQEVADLFKTYE